MRLLVQNHWMLVTLLEKKYQLVIRTLIALESYCNIMPINVILKKKTQQILKEKRSESTKVTTNSQ